MNWLMGRLNMEELAKDDVYALNYFLDKFVAWTGYQIPTRRSLAERLRRRRRRSPPISNGPAGS